MAEDSGDVKVERDAEDAVDTLTWPSRRPQTACDGKKPDSVPSSKPVDSDPYLYRMDYPCMGTCLIINNKNFHPSTGMNLRNGTDVDAANISKAFKNLGYKPKLLNDQTVAEMKAQLKKVSEEDHSQNASFVCVLLSHGDEGVIYGTDGFEKIDTLINCFKRSGCLSLVGKPKLFFIQACRGTQLDEGVRIETDAVEVQTSEKIPVEADFLYMYSSAPGYYSWRNMVNGSWFIQSLCEMLERFGGQLELMQILTRVNHKVALHFKSSSNLPGFDDKKQIPSVVSMLTKDLYFPQL